MIIGLSGVQNRAESRLDGHFFFLIFSRPELHMVLFVFVRFLSRLVIFYLTFGNFINSVLKLTVPSARKPKSYKGSFFSLLGSSFQFTG